MGFLAALVVSFCLVELPFGIAPIFPPFVDFPGNKLVFEGVFLSHETTLHVPLNLPLLSLALFIQH
jgi:hypothetical protein